MIIRCNTKGIHHEVFHIEIELLCEFNPTSIFSSFDIDENVKELKEALLLDSEQDYNDLVMNIIGFLKQIGYHILDSHPSNRKKSKSYYIDLCKENEFISKTVEIVIYLRVSGHELLDILENGFNRRERELDHYDEEMNSPPYWTNRTMIVNNEICKTYTDVYKKLRSILDEI